MVLAFVKEDRGTGQHCDVCFLLRDRAICSGEEEAQKQLRHAITGQSLRAKHRLTALKQYQTLLSALLANEANAPIVERLLSYLSRTVGYLAIGKVCHTSHFALFFL